ncbi:MAG: DUF971 domain-containing protein [Pirellulales bacterium]
MQPVPQELELSAPAELTIRWSDGTARIYSVRELREACPCASCREKRTKADAAPPMFAILSAEEAQPLKITGMEPIGAYAYSIRFNDGHETGIFPLELLYDLGTVT